MSNYINTDWRGPTAAGRAPLKKQEKGADLDLVREGEATQADLDRYASVLRESVTNGTISLDEFEAKLGAVYAAQTVAELEVLVPWLSTRRTTPSRHIRRVAIGLPVALLVLAGVATALALTVFAGHSPARRAGPSIHAGAPASAAGAPSAAPATTSLSTGASLPMAASQASQPTSGWPGNGTVAVVAVDVRGHSFTVDTWEQDVTYPTCSHFEAVSAAGKRSGISGLAVGDFATLTTNPSSLCATSVRIIAAPSDAQCSGTGDGGDGTVVLLASNVGAHSLVYRGTDSSFIQAVRWCGALTAVGADGRLTSISTIPAGTLVTTDFSQSDWVTALTVGRP